MADANTAQTLGITEGAVVWVVGDTVEEAALLDPVPADVLMVDEPAARMDAALIFVDNTDEVAGRLDEVLPQLGSTPVIWLGYPPAALAAADLTRQVAEYGWKVVTTERLDETWTALRLQPS